MSTTSDGCIATAESHLPSQHLPGWRPAANATLVPGPSKHGFVSPGPHTAGECRNLLGKPGPCRESKAPSKRIRCQGHCLKFTPRMKREYRFWPRNDGVNTQAYASGATPSKEQSFREICEKGPREKGPDGKLRLETIRTAPSHNAQVGAAPTGCKDARKELTSNVAPEDTSESGASIGIGADPCLLQLLLSKLRGEVET